VHDIDEFEGAQFISMEYVDGEDLSSLLHRIGRVHGDKAHDIARQLCAGLQAAHEQGVLHCDLKPANVMLDGEGDVRIADFGIAAAAGGSGDEPVRGTPAYMAPELFSGAPTTVASDLYSLGLVLYEVYTGKRLFDANSMTELLEKHRTAIPHIRDLIENIDPNVEAVIGRLLERDPERRPPSAMAVLAQLPGGDPLAAALASGETPSPELIAEAGGTSTLRKRTAGLLVGGALVGWLLICWLAEDVKLVSRANLQRSGQVLAQTAKDFEIELFGARPDGAVAEWRFERNDAFASQTDDNAEPVVEDWSRRFAAPWPNILDFFYRSSEDSLVPANVKGRIRWNDPPFASSGMIRMRLTPTGHLVELQSIPADVGTFATPPPGATDAVWGRLFHAAGLDLTKFRAVQDSLRLIPNAPISSTAAWIGTYPGTDKAIRVEAAERNGRPVHFVVSVNRDPPSLPERYPSRRTWRYQVMILLMLIATGMAWFHVARGRSDRRGAAWIGIATVGFVVGFTVLTGDHNGRLTGFFELINKGMGHGLLVSGQLIVYYLALEPHVRRAWPETMIAWSRLLTGRFQDSLVGHHLLVGVVVGVWLALFIVTRYHVVRLAGQPEGPPLMFDTAALEALVSPISAVGSLLEITVDQTRNAMKLLMGLVMLRLLVKSKIAAAVLAVTIFTAVFTVNPGGVGGLWYALGIAGAGVSIAAVIFLLMRFGVFSVMVSLVVSNMLVNYPTSLDPNEWYASCTLLSFLVVAGLALHGFRCATRVSR
jgi:Protein kinase domain